MYIHIKNRRLPVAVLLFKHCQWFQKHFLYSILPQWFCYKFFQWVPGTHLGESCGSQAKFYESSVGVPTIILTKQKISINNYCTTTGIQICKSLYWDNVYICLDFDNYMAFWKGNWYHTAYLSSYSLLSFFFFHRSRAAGKSNAPLSGPSWIRISLSCVTSSSWTFR